MKRSILRTSVVSLSVVLFSSALVPPAGAATTPIIIWNQLDQARPQLLPSSKYTTSSIASTNSTGKKVWSVSGACTLKSGIISTKVAGFCTVKIVIKAKGNFSAKSFSKRMKLIPATTTTTINIVGPKVYKVGTPWGEVSVVQIAGPKPGQCVDVPITVDVRKQSGLSSEIVIGMKDDYENLVGAIFPASDNGVQDLSIHVCRESWVYTSPRGTTSDRAASLYCGFWITSYPGLVLRYFWSDSVCKESSDRLV